MENKYPKFVVGAFIINNKNELFLRTSPSQGNRYTCINGKVEWGRTIKETLEGIVKEKTNLDIKSFKLIGLTDGLNIKINNNPEPVNMVFADYKARVEDVSQFKTDDNREHKWLLPNEWLKMDKDKFGPYIYEIIERLSIE